MHYVQLKCCANMHAYLMHGGHMRANIQTFDSNISLVTFISKLHKLKLKSLHDVYGTDFDLSSNQQAALTSPSSCSRIFCVVDSFYYCTALHCSVLKTLKIFFSEKFICWKDIVIFSATVIQ